MLRYRGLSQKQKDFITNGCGGKGGWIPIPDFIFTASCNHHDFNYWLGGTEADRIKADWQFYEAMIEDANSFPWYRRYWYKTLAWIYYRAVRTLASSYFNYGKEKTYRDLLAEMNNG